MTDHEKAVAGEALKALMKLASSRRVIRCTGTPRIREAEAEYEREREG